MRTAVPFARLRRHALSAMRFSWMAFLPRMNPDAVMSTRAPQFAVRPASASAEKPPKTTQCTAPMRAHASSAIGSCRTIGM